MSMSKRSRRSSAWFPFLMATSLLLGCRRERGSTPSDDTTARSTASAVASDAGPVRSSTSVGVSPRVDQRYISLGVYFAKAVSPTVLKDVQAQARKRFPDLQLRTEPGDASPRSFYVLAPALESFAPPTETRLARSGKGLDEAQIRSAAASKGVLLLVWRLETDPKFEGLQKAYELAADLVRLHHGFVWDETSNEMFSPDSWKKLRLDTWSEGFPEASHQYKIDYYQDGSPNRALTFGLVKLGVPDLVFGDLPAAEAKPAAVVMNACAQLLAEGRVPDAEGVFDIDFHAIRNVSAREAALHGAPAGARLRAHVKLVPVQAQKDDPENRMLELHFEGYPGATEPERLTAMVDAVYGSSPDNPTETWDDDAEFLAVKSRVQARLPTFAADFQKGLPAGERISVKASFDTDDGRVEKMWLDVIRWKQGTITGRLDNDPSAIRSLRRGATVDVKESSVFDCVRWKKDGSREGGESIDIFKARSKKK